MIKLKVVYNIRIEGVVEVKDEYWLREGLEGTRSFLAREANMGGRYWDHGRSKAGIITSHLPLAEPRNESVEVVSLEEM